MDLVEIKAIEAALQRDRDSAAAWLRSSELAQLGGRSHDAKALAGRVAAKEAVAKALGTGFAGDVAWQDVEVVADPEGRPGISLSGGAKSIAESLGVVRVLVTITHTSTTAGACALAITRDPKVV